MDLIRIFRLVTEWRARRDELSWRGFEDSRSEAAARSMRIGEVMHVRQEARTGTKAYMRWIGSGETDAVWARYTRLRRGEVLPVAGSYGYGPHHDELVFYVDAVGRAVRRRTYNGWARYEWRRTASG